MLSELTAQIFSFVTHSQESDEVQLLALLHGRMDSHVSHEAAVILGRGFEGKRWTLGSGEKAATLTEMTSFAELCVQSNHSHLLRTVVEAGAPAALANLGLDTAGWLAYLCRTRTPQAADELPGDEFVSSSLFVLATNSTQCAGGGESAAVFDSVKAANVLDALRLAFEVYPTHTDVEIARARNGVSCALVSNAEMGMAISSSSRPGRVQADRRRASAI